MNDKKRFKEITLFICLILTSFVLMGLDKLTFLNFLKRPVEQLTNPLKLKIYQVKKLKITSLNCPEEPKQLNLENADLQVKIINLEQENSSMRKLLQAPLPSHWKFIPSKVLGVKDNILTIDKGSDDGLKENQIVVWENFLVGRIVKPEPVLSRVKLPFAKDEKIKAKILPSSVKGVVRVDANASLVIDEVSPDVELKKDQIVVTTGEDEIYPPNLLIGNIESLEKKESAVYQKAILKPFLDYSKLNEVFVINK